MYSRWKICLNMVGAAMPMPLWRGTVFSARWLAASATAAVEGRGGMYVCVESDAALLAWLGHSVIRQETRYLPQEGGKPQVPLGWNLHQLKKKPKAKGSSEETNKIEHFSKEMLSMFSIRRRNPAASLFPSLSLVNVMRVTSGAGLDRQLDTENM